MPGNLQCSGALRLAANLPSDKFDPRGAAKPPPGPYTIPLGVWLGVARLTARTGPDIGPAMLKNGQENVT